MLNGEPRRRLTREESRTQTKERLREAALELFSRDGVELTSIEEIAECACYSRGAFYSNYDSKEDLLLDLIRQHVDETNAGLNAIFGAAITPQERLERLRDYALALVDDCRECMFFVEVDLFTIHRPELRARVAALMREHYAVVTHFVGRLHEELGVPDAPPPEIITASFMAMATGLAIRQTLEPEHFTSEMSRAALRFYLDSIFSRNPKTRSGEDSTAARAE